MKVKCIKTKLEDYPPFQNYKDQSDYLNVGDEFIVYGLSFARDGRFDVIIWGGPSVSHLIFMPLDFFELIDNTVPSCWKIGVGKHGEVTLGPDLFFQEDFWENHPEYEPKEREQFKALREEFDKI